MQNENNLARSIELAEAMGENPICYTINTRSGTSASDSAYKLINETATVDVKTITTLSIIPKGEGDIETIKIPDFKNTDIATYCTLTKAQFDGYVAYDSGLSNFSGYINDRGYPAYGIAARYGAYQFGQLPCAVPELLAVKDRQAHVAMTYRESSYSKTYVSDPVYYLINFKSILTSTLKKGILDESILDTINSINKQYNVCEVIPEDEDRTISIQNRHYMRESGLNGGIYIFYGGISSISNFDFDITEDDTLKISFEAGDYE